MDLFFSFIANMAHPVLRFDVRSPTYFLKCKDQNWYITQLEGKLAQQTQLVSELNQRIETLETDLNLPLDSMDGSRNLDADADTTAEEIDDSCTKNRRHKSRMQMIQLLDLNDNQDTEETISDHDSDVSCVSKNI